MLCAGHGIIGTMDREALDRARRKAEAIGIANMQRHIFLCCDQTKPKCCDRGGVARVLGLPQEAPGRTGPHRVGLRDADEGELPAHLRRRPGRGRLYPEGVWYWGCTPEVLERVIQDHLIDGRVVVEQVIAGPAPRPAPPAD